MSSVYNSQAFYYVLVIGFAAYTAYYLWKVFQFLAANYKARKKYLAQYGTENTKTVNQFWWWTAGYSLLIIYSIYSVVTIDSSIEQAEWFRMAFLFIALILLGQMLVAAVKRSALVGPEAFVVEDAVVPWKSVLNMDPKKRGLQRIVELQTTQGKYTLSREMGLVLHKEHEEWKKRRKEAKEKKKEKKK
ncbi:MAG: hypothetical protein IIZ10_10875 [Solobacterium sp.]|jgi:hypothetical protein|nr:hypothetical protein [Solobacterium sp.]MBQ8067911.1 hypothetical protein [Solobacterium sp.]